MLPCIARDSLFSKYEEADGPFNQPRTHTLPQDPIHGIQRRDGTQEILREKGKDGTSDRLALERTNCAYHFERIEG